MLNFRSWLRAVKLRGERIQVEKTVHEFGAGDHEFAWKHSCSCLLLRQPVFRIESSAKPEWLVMKGNWPRETERRKARPVFPFPFLFVRNFSSRRDVLVRSSSRSTPVRQNTTSFGNIRLRFSTVTPLLYFAFWWMRTTRILQTMHYRTKIDELVIIPVQKWRC